MQAAVPDSTQSDSISADRKEKKKKAAKKKKRKAESKESKNMKKKKTGKGKSKPSAKSANKHKKPDKTTGADGDDPDLDLSIELKPIGEYIKDREEMLEQMFACVQADRLSAMLPNILKSVSMEEVKALCLTELEGMSKKRIRCILEGKEMSSSSGTEESESDAEAQADNNEDNPEDNSPSNQMADSTSNLQASDNQSEHSNESVASSRTPSMEAEYEEEEAAYQDSEQEYAEEEEASYHSEEQMEEDTEDAENYAEEEVMQEGEEVEQYEEMEEQYVDEETEYIQEEAIQQEDEEMAPQEDVDERTYDGSDDNGDNDDRQEHFEDKETSREEVKGQIVEGEEGGRGVEMDDKQEANTLIPRRSRKDVDEADVEEGEVFDDDEEPAEKQVQNEGQEVKVEDNSSEITTTQEGPSEQGGETKMDTQVEAEQDGANNEQIDQVPKDQQELSKNDTQEQGKEDIKDQVKEDTSDQGKGDARDEGKEDIQEQGNENTQELDKEDTLEVADKGEDAQGHEDVQGHEDEQGHEDQRDQVSDVEEGRKETNQKSVDISSESKLVEDSGILPSCTKDEVSTGTRDDVGSSEQIVRTTDAESCMDASCAEDKTTYVEESEIASDAGAEEVSGDDKNSCVDESKKGDDLEGKRDTEPSARDNTMVSVGSGEDNDVVPTAKKDGRVFEKSTNDDQISANSSENVAMTMSGATMEIASEGDGRNYNKEDAVSVSTAGSKSSSDGDESESSDDESGPKEAAASSQVVEGDAQPVSDELEMLELELRARAIRSLMKKMGKD